MRARFFPIKSPEDTFVPILWNTPEPFQWAVSLFINIEATYYLEYHFLLPFSKVQGRFEASNSN